MTAPPPRLDFSPILVGNVGNVLFGSLTILGAVAGVLLASVVVELTRAALTTEQVHAWGGRLPFAATAMPSLGVDTGAAAPAYCRHMSSHLKRASGKSRLGSRRKGRPATVVACERRDPI